jgi:hypothetical protein
MSDSLSELIKRSAVLKRDLVNFAESGRFGKWLEAAMLKAAGPEGEIDGGAAINVIDNFALQHRLPDGKTVVDRFVASQPGLSATDREMLLGWRDPVEGFFEIVRRDGMRSSC